MCEASYETRLELKRLDEIHLTAAIFDQLLAKHRDDLFLHERYQQFARELAAQTNSGLRPLIEHYRDLSAKNADNKAYAYLYARALVDTGTPLAIETLKKILSSEPQFSWAHRQLALIYIRGNFANVPEARAQLEMFHRLCPASLDHDALAMLARYATPDTAAQYAAPLRERLTKETDARRRGRNGPELCLHGNSRICSSTFGQRGVVLVAWSTRTFRSFMRVIKGCRILKSSRSTSTTKWAPSLHTCTKTSTRFRCSWQGTIWTICSRPLASLGIGSWMARVNGNGSRSALQTMRIGTR